MSYRNPGWDKASASEGGRYKGKQPGDSPRINGEEFMLRRFLLLVAFAAVLAGGVIATVFGSVM
jgi:hypothetical protein